MKFLFVSTNFGCGASEDLWTEAATILSKSGHIVHAIAPWPTSSDHSKRRLLDECKVHYYSLGRSPSGFQIPIINEIRFWKRNLLHTIRKVSPDLLIISNGSTIDSNPIASTVAECAIPTITVDHGIFENRWPTDEQIASLLPMYLNASANFFVSQHSADLAERQLASNLPRARVVRNPYKVAYKPVLNWPEGTKEPRFAVVGRLLNRHKGQDILLEILASDKWRNRKLKVNCFGAGPNTESLQRETQRKGLENVKFQGHSNDVSEIWKSHHALLMPSRQENMPLTVVEAMLCGRVCICTAVGGIPELIDDGETGYLAPFPTVAALDDALERAWQQQDQWREIGAKAAESIRGKVPENPAQEFADIICSFKNDQ